MKQEPFGTLDDLSSTSSMESRPQELLPPDAANLDEDFIDMLLI